MIYLDHAAATPVNKKVKAAIEPYFSELFFNPSAPYLPAKRVREDYEEAKNRLAHLIGAKGNDLVITSGATEATNLAFTVLDNKTTSEALVLETEHASVISTAKKYNTKKVKVKPSGLIDLQDLSQKITDRTMFISVSIVNNELGTIQPIAEIAEIIKKARKKRLEAGNLTPLFLHSDASQALGLLNLNVARLKTDLLTLNSAKVYGPKGVGALYVAHGVKLSPITTGGGQERGLRSGTENVPGLIGFAVAAEEAKKHLNINRKKYETFRKIFHETLVASFSDKTTTETQKTTTNSATTTTETQKTTTVIPLFLGHQKHQLANFCPISFPGLDAERLIYKLEEQEIYLSTGAACAASKGEASHVLKAIGLSEPEIAGSLRISFGETNDESQIRLAAEKIATAAKEEYDRISHEK